MRSRFVPLRGGKTITTQISAKITLDKPKLTVADVLWKANQIAEYAAANAAKIDKAGVFPKEEFEQIAAAGLLTVPLSRHLGGLGLGFETGDTEDFLMLLKAIGWGNLAVGRVYEGHVNALQLIQTFATPEQIEIYAADARDGQKIFGVWNAQASDGIKIIPLNDGKYRLEGSKTFCSGCGYVERPFVNGAMPDGSWQMCIVPMDEVKTVVDPDWWHPLGMRSTVSYKVDFTGVEVDSNALIGKPGQYLQQPWLSGGVVRFAAVQLGGAEALFDATRKYLQNINRIDHPHQQERMGKMAIAIESGNQWLRGAARIIDQYAPIFGGYPDVSYEGTAKLVAYANMTRSAIEQICLDVIGLSERCIGTLGLLEPHPMERMIRDLTIYLRQPAFDVAITNVGHHVLSESLQARELWSLDKIVFDSFIGGE
jgi:alkylation response protein AidB-like acyl-CoA dehydrogenase